MKGPWNCMSRILGVGENFTSKPEDLSFTIPPGFAIEAGLTASFCEKLLSVQTVLDSDLREQQTAMAVTHDEQSMPTDFDGIWMKRHDCGEYRDFNRQAGKFVSADRREPGVFQGSAYSAFDQCLGKATLRVNRADAAAEFTLYVKRHENTALFSEETSARNLFRHSMIEDSVRDS
jgi:hypothetical protein